MIAAPAPHHPPAYLRWVILAGLALSFLTLGLIPEVREFLHRAYAAEFGLSNADLEQTRPSAAMTGYTSYMLNVAQAGGVENAAAAVLACAWSYNFIGQQLAARHPQSLAHPLYGKWVQMYSSPEFTALAERCITLVNRLAAGKPAHELQALEDIVVKTSYFEYMFWDMAETTALWPVPVLATPAQ